MVIFIPESPVLIIIFIIVTTTASATIYICTCLSAELLQLSLKPG
jgi:hypothetical protein